jgi:hypothetical protein
MTEIYKPFMRVLVVAALALATATLMLVAVNTVRAAGALAIGTCGAFGEAYDFRTIDEAQTKRGCAAFAVDFTNPCGAHGWGKGARLGRSQNAALQACYQDGGKDCVIRTFFCDAKG